MHDSGSSQSQSVLVTGANGFVGTRLCRHLHAKGYHVIAGVRKSADLSLLKETPVEYRCGDVTQPGTLAEMVKDVDYICHSAGLTKAKRIQQLYDVNETGTRNLFKAIVDHNPNLKKVLLISSLAVVGGSRNGEKITEESKPRPITHYAKSKLAGERTALEFKEKFPLVVIRPHGVYGPGDKEVFSFFDTVNKGIKPYVGNPERFLQMVHVDDLCNAIEKALTAKTASGAIYSICENQSYSMKEMIGLLEQASGKKAYVVRIPGWLFRLIGMISGSLFKLVGAAPMLTGDKAEELLAAWEVSTEKGKRDLQFEARIPFERGAKETFEWYRKEGWLK
ncbi:MAG: SDR family NAD(P)-dependent oxidoreductase [bacterium]|nr:SDR family NAD(P)-dependent oxidoreductase [bacterium]